MRTNLPNSSQPQVPPLDHPGFKALLNSLEWEDLKALLCRRSKRNRDKCFLLSQNLLSDPKNQEEILKIQGEERLLEYLGMIGGHQDHYRERLLADVTEIAKDRLLKQISSPTR
jgi:hypothetical protein